MFHYCDGASFLGNAGKVTRGEDTLHFDGIAIVDNLLKHLHSTFKLGEATDVLVTGLSAGSKKKKTRALKFFVFLFDLLK